MAIFSMQGNFTPTVHRFQTARTQKLGMIGVDVVMYDMFEPQITAMITNARQRGALMRGLRFGTATGVIELQNIIAKGGGHGVVLTPRKKLSGAQISKVINAIQSVKRRDPKLAAKIADRHLVDGTQRYGLRKTTQASGRVVPPLAQGLRYEKNEFGYSMGWVNSKMGSAGRAVNVVQRGLRGEYPGGMKGGSQQISAKGKRYMLALFGGTRKISTGKTPYRKRKYSKEPKTSMRARFSPKNDLMATYWTNRRGVISKNVNMRSMENLLGYRGAVSRPYTRKDKFNETIPDQIQFDFKAIKGASTRRGKALGIA